ncbi:hypothetical protein ACIPZF_18165 [Pseudomonas sp. NPDC089752]|uniref:hypothetical protein n=1 Tax=Pseudomonas sp. NPDC089752 TaxID=3364472 RepID=UPI00381269E8
MTIIHDQAMHYIYQQVLERLLSHMSQAQRASLQLLIQRLLVAAGGPEYIGTFRVLVVQGGDHASARLLAMVRAAQLSIALRAPVTFQLRVLVVCLPVASSALLEQHERSFNTLFMQDDPRVQLQMIDAGAVTPFSRRPTAAADSRALARDGLLLFGHLIDSRPEALLGSRLHLEVADSVRLALGGQPRADVLLTAMPVGQRRRYLVWARRSLRLAGGGGSGTLHQCVAGLAERLGRLQHVAVLPQELPDDLDQSPLVDSPLRLMAIDDLLPQLLSEGELDRMMELGMEPAPQAKPLAAFLDTLAFEQLQGLRTRCTALTGSRRTLSLVGQPGLGETQVPQSHIAKAYGLERTQLMCLFHSPFVDHGRGLERFLQCCHPDMLVALPYLHRALQGKACPEAVKHWLTNTSGLSLTQLRTIYDSRVQSSVWRMLESLARRDVHLALLSRRRTADRVVCEACADGA